MYKTPSTCYPAAAVALLHLANLSYAKTARELEVMLFYFTSTDAWSSRDDEDDDDDDETDTLCGPEVTLTNYSLSFWAIGIKIDLDDKCYKLY